MARGGASGLQTAIIASVCQDGGACIMCRDCGHVFVPSNPLSGESQRAANNDLARRLWYHMCPIDNRSDGKVAHHGR